MFQTQVEKEILAELQKHSEDTKSLELDGFCISQLTSAIKESLEKFKSLKRLSLKGCELQSLVNFPSLQTLSHLDISENSFPTTELGNLTSSVPNITTLILSNSNIIKATAPFADLQPLVQLKELEVKNTPLSAHENYRKFIFDLLPSLETIDGFDKKGKKIDFDVIEEEDFQHKEHQLHLKARQVVHLREALKIARDECDQVKTTYEQALSNSKQKEAKLLEEIDHLRGRLSPTKSSMIENSIDELQFDNNAMSLMERGPLKSCSPDPFIGTVMSTQQLVDGKLLRSISSSQDVESKNLEGSVKESQLINTVATNINKPAFSEIGTQIDDFSVNTAETSAKLQSLEEKVMLLNAELQGKEQKIIELEQNLKDFSVEMEKIKTLNQEFETQIKILVSESNQMATFANDLAKKNEDCLKEKQEVEVNLVIAQDEMSKLKEQLSNQNQSPDQKDMIESLRGEITRLESDTYMLSEHLTRIQQEKISLEQENQRLQAQTSENSDENQSQKVIELQKQLSTKENYIQTLQENFRQRGANIGVRSRDPQALLIAVAVGFLISQLLRNILGK